MTGAAIASRPARVLVIELAGLGDNVHLLPALWLVRRHFSGAELHVLVHERPSGLFELAPWVDRVWPYPGNPKPGVRANLRWARALRRERFGCVINTTGTDRSSLLAFATGAPVRIGRLPADGGPPGWRRLYTQVVETPYYTEPMYWQKWRCVRQAGIGAALQESGLPPKFHVTIDPELRRRVGIGITDEGRYIHVSPFTSADARELPLDQLASLITRLAQAHPGLSIALSCADNPREREKLDSLLPLLEAVPWKVFAGTLSVAGLAAVIEKSAVSLSGDTGSLHLAMLTGAPAVAWFRAHKGQNEWIPRGAAYRVLVAQGGAPDALHGMATDALVDAVREVVAA